MLGQVQLINLFNGQEKIYTCFWTYGMIIDMIDTQLLGFNREWKANVSISNIISSRAASPKIQTQHFSTLHGIDRCPTSETL